MEVLNIQPTRDTPEVVLNKSKGVFLIAGNSFPEDPFSIYGRVVSWLKEYEKEPNKETIFEFKLNYINTATSKYIYEVLNILEVLDNISAVKVLWYYQKDDDDTYNEGVELSQMISLSFDFVEF